MVQELEVRILRRRRIAAILLALFTAGAILFTLHLFVRARKARVNGQLQFLAAKRFLQMNLSVQENAVSSSSHSDTDWFATWTRYLNDDHPYDSLHVVDHNLRTESKTRVFAAALTDPQATHIWVAISPDDDMFFSMCLIRTEFGGVEQRRLIGYMPTGDETLYVANLESNTDEVGVVRKVLHGWDWRTRSEPDTSIWTHLLTVKSGSGWCEPTAR